MPRARGMEGNMEPRLIMAVVLVLLLLGVAPMWPYSRTWGAGPVGIVGVLLVMVLVLLVLGG